MISLPYARQIRKYPLSISKGVLEKDYIVLTCDHTPAKLPAEEIYPQVTAKDEIRLDFADLFQFYKKEE